MPRIHCKNFGQALDGNQCDQFDRSRLICLGDGDCDLSYLVQSKEEIEQREAISLPTEISDLKLNRQSTIGIDQVMSYRNDIVEPLNIALSIIDKMNPYNKVQGDASDYRTIQYMNAYWESPKEIDKDMGMLSAMKGRLDVQAALAHSMVSNAEQALKTVKADKAYKIYESYRLGVRTEKSTEAWMATLRDIDPQVKEAQTEVFKAKKEAAVLYAMAQTIEHHINVLKKRLENIRGEWARDTRS